MRVSDRCSPHLEAMKRIPNLLISIFVFLVCSLNISCEHSSQHNKEPVDSSKNTSLGIVNTMTKEQQEEQQAGKTVYLKYCLTCHQSNGSGVPGMHPPLGPGSWVGKDPKELITILKYGLSGKIDVNGDQYKSSMPPQSKLTDEEIAEVLTYVRSSFGNNFKPVRVDLVKKTKTGQY